MTNNLDIFRNAFLGFDDFFNHFAAIERPYPPFNVKKGKVENNHTIEMALAGFKKEDIKIEVKDNVLSIEGEQDEALSDYVHKGISTRNFKRVFSLSKYMEVTSADMKDGVLQIEIQRNIPESEKPKRINIK